MKVAIVNLGQIVTGDWRNPFAKGDAIVCDGERIASVGTAAAPVVAAADVVIDAGGMTAIPGLIDSHVHITFGDYTPRQRTVGYLESYLHGGTTTAISASEVHVPGRPKDPEGVKALAVAAQRCFADYRPGGMRVIAGSVILEPSLKASDFTELAQKGVRLAKAGFGAVKTAYDYVPLVADAKAAGLITTCHTGGRRSPGRVRSPAITCSRCTRTSPSISTADRRRCRTPTSSGSSLSPKWRCRSARPETCARRCSARGWPISTGHSIASLSPPTPQPAAASCRWACSTPSPI